MDSGRHDSVESKLEESRESRQLRYPAGLARIYDRFRKSGLQQPGIVRIAAARDVLYLCTPTSSGLKHSQWSRNITLLGHWCSSLEI